MPLRKTTFGPLAIVLRGGGSKGHDPRTIGSGGDVGLDIQVPVTQTANVFQISQPDGTVVYAIPAGGTGTPLTAPGAIPLVGGTYTITNAAATALTLAAPTVAQNGMSITVISATAFAHTITATGLLQTGSAAVNLATFAAFAGARVTFTAVNGKWMTSGAQGVTFS